MSNFGSLLRNLRTSRSLTLEELAENLNKKYHTKLSKSSISRWETGDAEPKLDSVRILADYFGVAGSYFFSDMVDQTEVHNSKIETIAAHIDDDVTEEELEDIKKYIDFIKSQRKK